MTLSTAGRPAGRRYQFAAHGNSEQGARQGDHLIKNNAASSWGPGFGGGPTVVRFLPARNPDDPSGQSWDPYRLPTDKPNDFGDWFRRYTGVRSFGEPGLTMIIGDPVASGEGLGTDHFSSPAWVLYNAVHAAIRSRNEGRGWAALTQGTHNKGPALSKPTDIYVAQCFVMQHRGRTYQPPHGFASEHKPIVFAMSSSAGTAFLAALNQLREGLTAAPVCATPEECEAVYANGDPISLDHGRFVVFYKKGEDPRQAQQPAATAGWNMPQQQQQGQSLEKGYDCYMMPSFGNFPASLRQFEAVVASKVRRWDDVLYFPTEEEQALLIANQFPADMIAYAWRDHPNWIPEFVHERLRAAQSASVPAGVPGAAMGWPGAPVPGNPYGVPPGAQPAPAGWGAPPQMPIGAPPVPVAMPPMTQPGAPAAYVPPPTMAVPPYVAPQAAVPVAMPPAAAAHMPPTAPGPYMPPPTMAAPPAAAPLPAPPPAPAAGWGAPPAGAGGWGAVAPQQAQPRTAVDPAITAGVMPPPASMPIAGTLAAAPPLHPDPFAARPAAPAAQQPPAAAYSPPPGAYGAPALPPGYVVPPAPPGYQYAQQPQAQQPQPTQPPMQQPQAQQPPMQQPPMQQPPVQPAAAAPMDRGRAALLAVQAASGIAQ